MRIDRDIAIKLMRRDPEPWALAVPPRVMIIVVVVCVAVQDRAPEQLHVQAWQLAQLVPEK